MYLIFIGPKKNKS